MTAQHGQVFLAGDKRETHHYGPTGQDLGLCDCDGRTATAISAVMAFDWRASEGADPNTVYMLPADVTEAMSIAEFATGEFEAGRLALCSLLHIYDDVKRTIQNAARERRIGVIKNIGYD